MKTTKEIRERLKEMRAGITKNQWGRLGYWYRDVPPKANKGPFEIAPGLSIGAVGNFDAIARFSGNGHDVESNADYCCVVVNHIEDLLADIDELEEENQLLKQQIILMGAKQ